MNRLDYFMSKKHLNRFWWFQRNDYLPPLYADLSDDEFALLVEWFDETERLKLIGECNVPAMSALLGFVAGNGIDAIVQCGHYAGYSSLLLGWMLRRMGKTTPSLFSFDIDREVTKFADDWIFKAGLGNIVGLCVRDSADPFSSELAQMALSEKTLQAVFIDSSHQYEHTLEELNLWYEALAPGGFIFLHDVSGFAQQFDSTGQGGVKRAMELWRYEIEGDAIETLMVKPAGNFPIYNDHCGLGIIHKP